MTEDELQPGVYEITFMRQVTLQGHLDPRGHMNGLWLFVPDHDPRPALPDSTPLLLHPQAIRGLRPVPAPAPDAFTRDDADDGDAGDDLPRPDLPPSKAPCRHRADLTRLMIERGVIPPEHAPPPTPDLAPRPQQRPDPETTP